jgi:mono/diheme cytochrome c family protein
MMDMVTRMRAIALVVALPLLALSIGPAHPHAQAPAPARETAAPVTQTGQGQVAAQAPAGRVDAGAAIYRKVGCFQCHVNEGQGGANGPKVGPDPVPFARFTQYIRKPTGDMPPYTEKVLSAQDLADIYAFLRARPRPPAVSAIPLLAP